MRHCSNCERSRSSQRSIVPLSMPLKCARGWGGGGGGGGGAEGVTMFEVLHSATALREASEPNSSWLGGMWTHDRQI